MGATTSLHHDDIAAVVPAPVTLNIYNVGTSEEIRALNTVLRVLGSGAFHCGVEVYGTEWSYRATSPGVPGVFSRRPRDCEGHIYTESVAMGMTLMSQRHVYDVIRVLTREWPGTRYDVLRSNCCHFCDKLCQVLGVGSIPAWITNLANTGAMVFETGEYLGARAVSFGDKVDGALCGIPVSERSPRAAHAFSCASCLCWQAPMAGGYTTIENAEVAATVCTVKTR